MNTGKESLIKRLNEYIDFLQTADEKLKLCRRQSSVDKNELLIKIISDLYLCVDPKYVGDDEGVNLMFTKRAEDEIDTIAFKKFLISERGKLAHLMVDNEDTLTDFVEEFDQKIFETFGT